MINLTPKTKINIECMINQKVVNLEFDVENVTFQAGLSNISDLASRLGKEYKTLQDTKALEDKKNKICEQIQTEFENISPEFKKCVNGVKITSITVWLELMQQIAHETMKLETENNIIAEIEEEENEGLA